MIEASSGTSFVHETEGQLILKGSYDIGFTMDLACKDPRLAGDLGRELDTPSSSPRSSSGRSFARVSAMAAQRNRRWW